MDKKIFYFEEARTQIEFARYSYAAFQSAEDQSDIPMIFFHLHHFLIHATNAHRILDAKHGTHRHQILNGQLDLSGIDFSSFRRLRNHLEHFDERLDRFIKDYDGYPFFDMNIITGAKGFPKKAFLRALDGHTFKFFGEDYNMIDLHETLVELYGRILDGLSKKRP